MYTHIIYLSIFSYRKGRASSATSIVVLKPNICLGQLFSEDSW